jgi:hypothetical protein
MEISLFQTLQCEQTSIVIFNLWKSQLEKGGEKIYDKSEKNIN